MAFSLQTYINKGFSNIENTPEAIQEAINTILANENTFGALGSKRPLEWAKTAQVQLDSYNDIKSGKANAVDNRGTDLAQKALEKAFNWITGDAQGKAKSSVMKKFAETRQDIEKEIANLSANAANVLDIPPNASPEEKSKLQAQAEQINKELQDIIAIGKNIGANTAMAEKLVKTSSGFIPVADQVNKKDGREGQATTLVKNAQGGYDIVGADGSIIAANVSNDLTEALAIQQQRQGGSTPSIQGRPDLYAAEPTPEEKQSTYGKAFEPYVDPTTGNVVTPSVATPEQLQQAQEGTLPSFNTVNPPAETTQPSSILPPDIDLTGVTEEQKKDLEALYLNAGNSPEVMNKVINLQQLSEEDAKKFLNEAKDFVTAQYAQSFTRGSEDFQKSLEYAAANREAQIAQENLNKQLALEQSASSAADAGLATSGIRKKAEERLAQQAQDIATSSRRTFDYSMFTQGRNAEDILGSKTISGLNIPKVGGQSVYSSPGNIVGSLEQQRQADILQKQQQLQAQADAVNAELLASQGGVTTR